MKKISIGTWAFSIGPYAENPVPFETVLQKVQELGFDGVELGGFSIHPHPDNHPTKEDRERLKQQMKDHGLEFSGMVPNLWGTKLVTTDDHSEYMAEFRKGLQFSTDVGIKGIRVDAVQPPTIFDQVDEATARKRIVGVWQRCCDEAAAQGNFITWEFEPGFAFNKPSQIIQIVDEVGRDNFGVEFDTCHAHMVAAVGARQAGAKETLKGGALELAQKLRGKINHVHIIDSDGTLHDDETSTHAPFGDGVLDFGALLPELNRNPIPHNWWTIDLCFWPDAWVVTERCKKAADELNKRYG